MKFLEKLWADNLISAALTIVIGVLVTLLYKYALGTICVVVGIVALLIGLVLLVKYFRLRLFLAR